METLFDDKIRNYDGYSDHNETTYEFLNRTSRKGFGAYRQLLNNWFSVYPHNEKAEIKSRIKKEFDATFYELFLYQLFLRLGFEIIVHPEISTTLKRPDFLVSKNNLDFYVEAKVITGKSKSQKSFERKRDEFYDAIGKLNLNRFLISLDKLVFKNEAQPSTKKLISRIQAKIQTLNPYELSKKIDSGELQTLPQLDYEDDNIKVKIEFIPLNNEVSSSEIDKSIGVYPAEFSWGNNGSNLKKAIHNKAKRYGRLDRPLLICVNCFDFQLLRMYDLNDIIWGSKIPAVNNKTVNEYDNIKRLNGLFFPKTTTGIDNCSGLIISRIGLFNIVNGEFKVFKNPNARHELEFNDMNLSYEYLDNNKIIKYDGIELSEVFNDLTIVDPLEM